MGRALHGIAAFFLNELQRGTFTFHMVHGGEGHYQRIERIGGAQRARDNVLAVHGAVHQLRHIKSLASEGAGPVEVIRHAGLADEAGSDGFAERGHFFLQFFGNGFVIGKAQAEILRNLFGALAGQLAHVAVYFDDGAGDFAFVAIGVFRHHILEYPPEHQQPMAHEMVIGLLGQRTVELRVPQFIGHIKATAFLARIAAGHRLGRRLGHHRAGVGSSARCATRVKMIFVENTFARGRRGFLFAARLGRVGEVILQRGFKIARIRAVFFGERQ